jgi:hypothetical protein
MQVGARRKNSNLNLIFQIYPSPLTDKYFIKSATACPGHILVIDAGLKGNIMPLFIITILHRPGLIHLVVVKSPLCLICRYLMNSRMPPGYGRQLCLLVTS